MAISSMAVRLTAFTAFWLSLLLAFMSFSNVHEHDSFSSTPEPAARGLSMQGANDGPSRVPPDHCDAFLPFHDPIPSGSGSNVFSAVPIHVYTMNFAQAKEGAWGQKWRSSPIFIVSAMAMALFTDTFLYAFLVPILPYVLENRLGLDVSLTQRFSFALLSESAVTALITSPIIGHFADRVPNKRGLLLGSLAAALLGSIILALATSTFTLFAGRLVQAIASSVIWVAGYGAIAENVHPDHLATTYGVISLVVAAGTSGGPMVAGILFELGGYWAAWSSVFTILVADIIVRLLMLERPKTKESAEYESDDASDPENAPLLSETGSVLQPDLTGWKFYIYLLGHRRFQCGVISYFSFAVLISSFDTTLPLHVRDVFNWGSLPAGMMFFALQGPGIILSPLCGWLKDRVGTRWPTTVGFLLLAPVMWIIGMPGDERFPWINEGNRGIVIYAVAVTVVGSVSCLLNGAGTIEATITIDEIEAKYPGLSVGYSRALSMVSMSWTSGAFIGPVLSGFLAEHVGYYEMSCVIAVICALSGINAFFNLTSKKRTQSA
ncbi:MFS multidrug transporter [Aspergillus heteromorphus CBS 117.55]|uniref:MFS multidrug transporter n=1 Tax=Aspergillus heteromorphus CBS 117.55 TaxID=1448321 RepID=A0A317VQ75_9EURO|nr:MFS multidrug transporter [Aspergillus heteromorphus CBS 117.55]PWY75038.1 MFS multidrug transporter [Aspergillus heteromorphus CBS 117.55]